MDGPGPARLYASAAGALLVGLGILGFFYSASFGSPGEVDDALGFLALNGWANLLHVATGALGLLLAGFAARAYSLWIGLLYVAIAVWGFALGGGEIVGLIPVDTGENVLHLALGTLGLAAAAATPRRAVAPSPADGPKIQA